MKSIEIFKPGTHTAMNGVTLSFSEADLKATVGAYDPAIYEAPIVVGHPKLNEPAYGWVAGLNYDGVMHATPNQVDPAFAESVNAGRYKRISASFFMPDAPSNPVPGVYYLRHVGFLGAAAPAVQGLKNASFSETEEGVVEFGDWNDGVVAGLFRGLREWVISKFGLDEADKAIPKYDVAALEANAAQADADTAADSEPPMQYAEVNPEKGNPMSDAEKARLEALQQENQTLRAEAARRDSAARHAAHQSFAEQLVKQGKLLPAQMPFTVAFMDRIAIDGEALEFGEADQKSSQTLLQGFQGFLQTLPKQIEFSEVARSEIADTSAHFTAPNFAVDPEGAELHAKALAYQAAHPETTFIDAVFAVGGK